MIKKKQKSQVILNRLPGYFVFKPWLVIGIDIRRINLR